MPEDFLTQEEIDVLLSGNEELQVEEQKKDADPFDFSQVESIKKGGLPGLELLFERWVKLFSNEVRSVFPHVDMVSKENIYITKFGLFMSEIAQPSSYTTITMRPLKEHSLFVVDSRLVFAIISVFFGGAAKPFKVEGREFTRLELQVIGNFINAALSTFEEVWKRIYPVDVEKKSTELNPLLVRIVSPNEKVAIVECTVKIDDYEAPIFFCFPQSMFLPIKNIIYSNLSGEEDELWEKNLSNTLYSLKTALILEMARQTYKAKDILGLKIGDELMLNVSTDSDLKLLVGGIPKFICRLGKVKSKYAALIKKPISENIDG